MNEWIAVITALVSGGFSFWLGKNTNKTTLEKAQKDSDSKLEELYMTQLNNMLAFYDKQLQGLREEVKMLEEKFDKFQKEHEKEVNEYKKYIEMLEEENESLKVENEHLKEELSTLKGENK